MIPSRIIVNIQNEEEFVNVMLFCTKYKLSYEMVEHDSETAQRPPNPTPENQPVELSRAASPTGAVLQEPLLFKPDKEHRGFWGAEFLAKGYLSLSNAEVRLRNYANTYDLKTDTGFTLDAELKEMFNTTETHVRWTDLRTFLARSMLIV